MLARFLIERRRAIVRRYLPAVNPIVDVRLSQSGTLMFRNAAVDADVAPMPAEYSVKWRQFNNTSGASTDLGMTSGPARGIASPSDLPSTPGSYVLVEISGEGGPESWAEPVHAYFLATGSRLEARRVRARAGRQPAGQQGYEPAERKLRGKRPVDVTTNIR